MGTTAGAFSARANHQLRLETQVASQSIAGNYSTINWQLYAEKTSASTSYYLTAGGSSAANIGGNVWNGGGWSYDFRSTTTIALGSGSFNVAHNPDGTGSYSFSASATAPGTLGSASCASSEGLPTIARATQPTVSPGSGPTASTFTIGHSAASGSFYHDIYYSLDGGSNYTNILFDVPASTVSTPWTPAHTLLPNSTSNTVVILLRTRTSPGGTIIGDKLVSLPIFVPSNIIPVVSNVTWADAQTASPDIPTLMGGAGRFVQSWSSLVPTITSAGAGGSTISSSSVTQNGQVAVSGATFSSKIALSGAVPFSATATDSRSRVSDPYSNTIAVAAYNFPSLPTPLISRTSDAAGMTPSPTGTFLAITPSASVSALVFASVQKNLLEWQIRIKPTGGTFTIVQAWTAATVSGNTWTTKYVAAGPYASSVEWVVEVSIRDLFGKNGFSPASTVVSLAVLVPSEQVFMDWDGNNGIGIGKYRTNGMLDVAGPIYQYNGELIADGTKVTDTNSTYKDLVEWHLPGSNAGSIVIVTPITPGAMNRVHITGYNYEGLTFGGDLSDIDMVVSFYLYAVDLNFYNAGAVSRGTKDMTVKLARTGANTAIIILTPTNNNWSYVQINVVDAHIGLSTPGRSYRAGWSASLVAAPAYTGQVQVFTRHVGTTPGQISQFAGTSALTGFLLCDGAAVSRVTYYSLFTVIGTTYGAGDGTTTFNVPNLKGRIPVGYDSSQTEFNAMGKLGGAKTHQLSSAELPDYVAPNAPAGSVSTPTASGANYGFSYKNTGSAAGHNNLQPYMALNYIIKI